MPDGKFLDWIKQDLHNTKYGPPDEALTELMEEAKRLIRLYLERATKLRPSAVARELTSLAMSSQCRREAREPGPAGDCRDVGDQSKYR